ncbi:MAG: acyltransferase [Oscillospiraceae bacterium]|nr:acyltransferase [Oscillospiraceae bacterium]
MPKKPVRPARNSVFEVLRIIAMLLILVSHYSEHGYVVDGLGYSYIQNTFNRWLLPIFNTGEVGVILFVILSGYFLVDRQISLRRILVLAGEVWFYSVLVFTVSCLVTHSFHIPDLLKSLFPTLYGQYWFFTAYILLMCFTPFLNLLLRQLCRSRSHYYAFLAVALFWWSLLPTFLDASTKASSLGLFALFYAIGAGIRKGFFDVKSEKARLMWVVLLSLLWALIPIVMDLAGQLFLPFLARHSTHFFAVFSILPIALAAAIVAYTEKRPPFTSETINAVAAHVFAVYLLTDHPAIRMILWKRIFRCELFAESPWLILHLLGCVAGLFCAGVLIDTLRTCTIEPLFLRLLDRLESSRWYAALQDKLSLAFPADSEN